MVRIISLLIFAALFSNCVTQKRCNDKFPTKDSLSVITTVRDSIVHDSVKVYVPYQELTFVEESPCPPQVVYHKSVNKAGLKSTIDIKDGKITSKCEADSLKVIIEKDKVYIKTLEEKYSQKTKTIEIKYIPWWVIMVIILLVLSALFNAVNLIRK